MQHDGIVAPKAKLKSLHGRDHLCHVIGFAQNAKRQREYRILGIDIHHPMITAFVNVDDKVAEFLRYGNTSSASGELNTYIMIVRSIDRQRNV